MSGLGRAVSSSQLKLLVGVSRGSVTLPPGGGGFLGWGWGCGVEEDLAVV